MGIVRARVGQFAAVLGTWALMLVGGCGTERKANASDLATSSTAAAEWSAVVSARWGVRAKLPSRGQVVADDRAELEVVASGSAGAVGGYVLRASHVEPGADGTAREPLELALQEALNTLALGDRLRCEPAVVLMASAGQGQARVCRASPGRELIRAEAVRVGQRVVVAAARASEPDRARFLRSITVFDDQRTAAAREARRAARAALARGAYEEFCARMADEGFDPELCSGIAHIAQGRRAPAASHELMAAVRRAYGVKRVAGVWAQRQHTGTRAAELGYRPWPLMDALEQLFAARGPAAKSAAEGVLEDVGERWWQSYCPTAEDGHCTMGLETAQN